MKIHEIHKFGPEKKSSKNIKSERKVQSHHLSISPQHKKLYSKYRCEYKKKAIMTKLQNDSGYPQDLISTILTHPKKIQNNYLIQNTKNLKNFFFQRIPAENTLLNKLLKRQSQIIDPKRIFQIKHLEYQLKNQNKINLREQFSIQLQKMSKKSINKMKSSFQMNQKNISAKDKQKNRHDKMSLSLYDDKNNYRKGTQSHISKRSKILKKEAYDRVFGPDISSLSRTINAQPLNYVKPESPKAKSVSLQPTKQKLNFNHNLRDLIYEMNDYKNKLQDKDQKCLLPAFDEFQTKQQQNAIIEKIQSITKTYKTKNINQGHSNIEVLQDIKTFNKEYYSQLVNHKKNRLNKRNILVYESVNYEDSKDITKPFKNEFSNNREKTEPYGLLDQKEHSIISYRDVQDVIECVQRQVEQLPKGNAISRYKLLQRTLVRWASLFFIYGINRKDIFMAFRANSKPYQLQGSYAFFKLIKNGNLQTIKKFIRKNPKFIFQSQYYGKSSLSYACLYNQTEIGQFILQCGVVSDKKCNNNKTSLFYALHANNIQLTQAILRKGANPWSSSDNPYNKILNSMQNNEPYKILFNNSRKIYLGMQIQSTIMNRRKFWQKYKNKINTLKRMTFSDAF